MTKVPNFGIENLQIQALYEHPLMVIGRNKGVGGSGGGGVSRKLQVLKLHLWMLKDPNPNICGRPNIL